MFDFLNNAFGTAAYRDPTVTDLPEDVQEKLARRAHMQAGLAMMDAASGKRGQPMAGLGSVLLAGQRQGQEFFGQGVERAREGQSRAEGKAYADELKGLQDPEAQYQTAMKYAQMALSRGDMKRYEQYLQLGEQQRKVAQQRQLRGILSGGGQVMPSQARVGTPDAATPNLTGVPMAQPNAESPLPLGGVIQGTVPQQRNPQAQRMREAAQFLLQNGQIDEAKKLFDTAETLDPRPKAPEAFSLSPGQTRFGPDGRPMASMPTEDPAEVREYNFARQQGYKGSFEDWTIRKRQAGASQTNVSLGAPVSGLDAQGNPVMVQPANRPGQPSQVLMANGQPIRPMPTEASAKADEKRAGPQRVLNLLDQAEGLVAGATGSYAGALVDQGARVFGRGTEGAQKIAQLKAIEGALILNMPRLEGPQSNLDQQLYRQAAGQIGDPTVPPEIKKAAIETVKKIYQKAAAQQMGMTQSGVPANNAAQGGIQVRRIR